MKKENINKMKILYIMGVEWNWILQRPQILALALQRKYKITVVAPKQLFSKEKNINIRPQKIRNLYQLPLQEKSLVIRKLSDIINKKVFDDIYSYDVVWLGYPIYQRYIPDDYNGKIIYDCMDNFEALYPDKRDRAINYLLTMEKNLINRSDIVFVSSEKLGEKMRIYKQDIDPIVIRNGCKEISCKKIKKAEIKQQYVIGYVGTIAEWFDNSIVEISSKYNICYIMIGPVSENYVRIRQENVRYTGAIKHEDLYEKIKEIDCLIMPFKINDIVLYVDPVKLYEYIAWGKCIISSYYPEIERFRPFVYFYHNQEEFDELIKSLSSKGFPPKYNKEQQEVFLQENTWSQRMELIFNSIDGMLKM